MVFWPYRRPCIALAVSLATLWVAIPQAALGDDVEIVSIVGKGDKRASADAPWNSAAIAQKLPAGAFVRTAETSQMGLLLRDRTQVRLNELTILQIKSVNPGRPPPDTRLDLPRGRIWAQARQRAPVAGEPRPPLLEVNTPGAVARIRGTDWQLEVNPDGASTVTVVSGEVEFFNDQGSVLVKPNEQARAEPGKAPVKILLTSAADRVQWVTAYRPHPRRWVKDLSGGLVPVVRDIEAEEFGAALRLLPSMRDDPALAVRASLLLADLYLFLGRADEALQLLAPQAARDPTSAALLARTQMVLGKLDDAARSLDQALAQSRNNVELLLAQGELARLRGDTDGAREANRKVIALDPANADAWYAIGRIETEREYVAAARDALGRALARDPGGAGFQGELATLETFANEFAAAAQAFREALDRHPDDYVALTGLGVLQLKRGEPEAALDSFLKAGLLEPRYARAWFFTGVAQYQLGDRIRALQSFAKAASLDDKDPLPYLVTSLVHFDALELGQAIEAAREAQARLPFVKSLNQVLTNQIGNANLGAALGAFGLEEWSRKYAYDSYTPFWAGSPLFLANQYLGTYNRNSELYKGFLSDPAVFGASNRFSSIVAVPGHYGSVGATAGRDYISEVGASVSLNGYSVSATPLSYLVGLDKTSGNSRINRTKADGTMSADTENVVLGVGVLPSPELRLFAFANTNTSRGSIAEQRSGLTDDNYAYDYRRYDFGINYKFTPTSQSWLKIGGGSESLPMSGALTSQQVADTLNTSFATGIFTPAGRLNNFRYDLSEHDVQWRHTTDVSQALQLSWGLEYAKQKTPFALSMTFAPLGIALNQDNSLKSTDAYASGRYQVSDTLDAQLDLHYQVTRTRFATDQQFVVLPATVVALPRLSGETSRSELNPRFGLRWRPTESQTLRFAAQAWRKPAGVNTLAPVDTLGIALDDRIERAGGKFKRVRLQHEMQLDRATFFEWFADAKRVDNPADPGAGIVPDLVLDQLERLRTRPLAYTTRLNYLEEVPRFAAGRMNQAGFALNHQLSREATFTARYVRASTRNTGAAFAGREIPFFPANYANFTINWQPHARWVVGPFATWRSARFTNEANTERLTAGWSMGLSAYWESSDKHLSVGGLIDQIHPDKQSSIYRQPVARLQAIYRF